MTRWTIDAGHPPYSAIEFPCGCRLESSPDSAPVKAWECEHGNSIRAVDPPTGQQIFDYEQWLRTEEAHDYFASLTTYPVIHEATYRLHDLPDS